MLHIKRLCWKFLKDGLKCMAKWGSCDFKQLEELAEKLEKISKFDTQKFCGDVARELAARLLAKVTNRTPVGEYSQEITVIAKRDGKKHKKGEKYTRKINPTGKQGGTLRRGWTASTQAEAESGSGRGNLSLEDATGYANSLKISRMGNYYVIVVKNPVEYASYVEFGHRQESGRFVPAIGKRLKIAWAPGKFMLTISEKELEGQLPKLIERKLTKFMEECFSNGY